MASSTQYLTLYAPRVAHNLWKLNLAQLQRRWRRADIIAAGLVSDDLRSGRADPYVFAQNPARGALFDTLTRYRSEVATAIFYKTPA